MTPDNLPDDIESLKALVLKKQSEVDKKQARVEHLEEQWRLFLHRKFASQSEKAPGQGELFNEAEATAEDPIIEWDAEATPSTETKAKTRGRKPLPSELPRVKVIHDLPESERQYPCGCRLMEIGEETSEQLDIIPVRYPCVYCPAIKVTCKRMVMKGITLWHHNQESLNSAVWLMPDKSLWKPKKHNLRLSPKAVVKLMSPST